MRRSNIDERLVSNFLCLGNPVGTPDVLLSAAILDKQCFTIGVQNSSSGSDFPARVNSELDVEPESIEHFSQLLLAGATAQDMNHSAPPGSMASE